MSHVTANVCNRNHTVLLSRHVSGVNCLYTFSAQAQFKCLYSGTKKKKSCKLMWSWTCNQQ